MWRVLNPPFYYEVTMEKDRLKSIVQNLKLVIETLESEIYSDVKAYTDTRENYDDPIEYLNNDDDDGYPD
jgi:hypothetical protein